MEVPDSKEKEILELSNKIIVIGAGRDLSRLNLEEHVKRIELAMEIYGKIFKDGNKVSENDVSLFHCLGVLDRYQWCDETIKKDNFTIKKALSLDIVSMLFDLSEDSEKESDVTLGSFIIDLYNKKTAHVQTNCFDEQFRIKEKMSLRDYESTSTDSDEQNEKRKLMKEEIHAILGVLALTSKAEEYTYSHCYSKAEDCYEQALKSFNKNKDLIKNPVMLDFLIEKINEEKGESLSVHKSWIKKYLIIKNLLDKKSAITSSLTDQDIITVHEKFEKFKKDGPEKFMKSGYDEIMERAYYSAIKDHCLESVKILKQRKSPIAENIISKLYIIYSTVDKDDYSLKDLNEGELKHLKKAIKSDPSNLHSYYNLAKYHEKKNEKDKALEYWDNLVKAYFKRKDKVYEDIKCNRCSKNLVGKPRESEVFEDLIFKVSKNNLSEEYNITKLIYDLSFHKKSISEPVVLIQKDDNLSYLILRKAEDEGTLEDILEYFSKLKSNNSLFTKIHWTSEKEIINKIKLKYLEKVLDSLVEFQDSGKRLESFLKNYDYSNRLKVKLEELFKQNKEEVYKACSFLIDYLNNLPSQFCHGDFNPRNILAVKDGFCIIDYEKVSLVNKYFDLAYLLEQLDFNWKDKKGLIKYFKKKIKDNSSVKEVIKIYDHNALFVNLTLAGTCSQWEDRALEYQSLKQKYLNQTKGLLKKMENLYSLELSTLKNICE